MPEDDAVVTPQRGRHYDWDGIKAAYVEGVEENGRLAWPTLEECAVMYSATPANVRARASRDGWVEERALFRQRLEDSRRAERVQEIAALGADLDVSALRIARTGLTITAARLNELGGLAHRRAQWIQDRSQQPNHDPNATFFDAPPAPSTTEVRDLARAATDWFNLGRVALGDVPQSGIVLSGPRGPVELQSHLDESASRARVEGIVNVLLESRIITLDAGGGVDEGAERRGLRGPADALDTEDDEVRAVPADGETGWVPAD